MYIYFQNMNYIDEKISEQKQYDLTQLTSVERYKYFFNPYSFPAASQPACVVQISGSEKGKKCLKFSYEYVGSTL